MKVIYTGITSNLTALMIEELQSLRKQNKRIFYIVPSSLSFEKEREILEQRKILEKLAKDSETALFDVLVTRFKQLPYYFQTVSDFSNQTLLSSIGEAMLFRKVLNDFSDGELSYFDQSRKSAGFIEKLVALRQELVLSNLTAEDLPNSPKNEDLKKILLSFEEKLSAEFASEDDYSRFIQDLIMGNYQELLEESIFVIAGFTRFTAQEQMLVKALDIQNNVIIGTYASEKSLNQRKNVLGVYADSVKMIDKLDSSEIEGKLTEPVNQFYSKLTAIWEKENDFLSEEVVERISEKQDAVLIWKSENQIAEIEMLAKEIRRKVSLNQNRYKEFTVLVASTEHYELPVKQIFDLYDIPYFYSKQESMKNHPFIVFLESLYFVSKNNYQTVDVVNLLKTNFYTSENQDQISQENLDNFEYYLRKFKISGKNKFSIKFDEENYPENPSEFEKAYFSKAKEIEEIRENLISPSSPLGQFLSSRRRKKNILETFIQFINAANVTKNFQKLYSETDDNVIKDKHQQVWRLFQKNLKEFKEIFQNEVMSVEDFLEILISGVKNANYRQVPANVDVVKIRSYELIEPRENDYVYVIGLTNSNFPQVKKNLTLLTNEDREQINAADGKSKFIEEFKSSEHHKHLFTTLSLLNAARKRLVFSCLQISDNIQENESPSVLSLLENHGVPVRKVRATNVDEGLEHIGTSRSIIRSILTLEEENLSEKNNFWVKVKDYLVSTDEHFSELIKLDKMNGKLSSELSEDTVKQVYSKLTASVSAFEEFYNCQYKYFLNHTLKLQEIEEVKIESSTIGNYLHRIFQLTLKDQTNLQNFDARLSLAKSQVDSEYKKVFERDQVSRFLKSNLKEIIEQSAVMVKLSLENFKIVETENSFQSIDDLAIKGRIDRVDALDDYYGAIDYKSGNKSFNLIDIYNQTNLQLLTYLDVLSRDKSIWGAVYLHLHNPRLSLSDFQNLGQIDSSLFAKMSYQGLLNAELNEEFSKFKSINLTNSAAFSNSKSFSAEEISGLIRYNQNLYKKGFSELKSGKIKVNPLTQKIDDKFNVTGCRYCKFKSICRFEATRHSGRMINLLDGKTVNMKKDKSRILEELLKGDLNGK